MSCIICEGVELEVPRCPQCGRLPTDTQLAILTEAYDCLDVMEKMPNTVLEPAVVQSIRTLTGVVKHLVVENNRLKREILVLKESDKYQ